MKLITKPGTSVAPQELALAHRYLIATFVMQFSLGIAILTMKITERGLQVLDVFNLISLVGSILLLIALYNAATKLGFSKAATFGAIILSFFLSPLALILVVSADLRISKQLKAKGWKVGLLGAKPA